MPPIPLGTGPRDTFAFTFAQSALNHVSHTLMGGIERQEVYWGNRTLPNVVPNLMDLTHLFYSNSITYDQLKEWALDLGINLNRDGAPRNHARMWNKILWLAKPQPSLEAILKSYYLDGVTGDRFRIQMNRMGFKYDNDIQQILRNSQPLDPATIVSRYRQGEIGAADAAKYLRHGGYRDNAIVDHVLRQSDPIPLGMVMDLANRGKISDDELLRLINWNGILDTECVGHIRKAMKNIPGPSDIVQFALKEGWDQTTVDRFGYDDEFPPEFRHWMKQLGYDWAEDVVKDDGTTITGVPWPKLYWRAHWQQISPGQAYEMLHRLRATGGANNGPRVAGVPAFTMDDVRQVLKIADYPRAFRDRLAAISYRVLDRRDLVRMYQAKIIDRAELKETFKDYGFDDTNADRLVRSTDNQIGAQQLTAIHVLNESFVAKSYKLGVASRDDTFRNMYLLFLRTNAFITEYVGKTPENQLAEAQSNSWVQQRMRQLDIEIAMERVTKTLAAVRKAYLRYEVTDIQVRDALALSGVVPDVISRYIQTWNAERIGEGREASASQILQWYRQRLLTPADAQIRLARLGYGNADIALMVQSANIQISAAMRKQLEGEAKLKRQQQKLLVQQANESQAELNRLRAIMARSATIPQLLKWVKRGLIPLKNAYDRIRCLGRSHGDAMRGIDEIVKSKDTKEYKEFLDYVEKNNEGKYQSPAECLRATNVSTQPGKDGKG